MKPPFPGSTVTVTVIGFSRARITGRVNQIGHRWWDIAGQRIPVNRIDTWERAPKPKAVA